MAVLMFKIKDLAQRKVDSKEFKSASVLIGRGSECQLVLNQNKVSRHHAEVTFKDGMIHVMDLRSRDGVFVNGERITSRMRISSKDVIGIGDYRLRVAGRERSRSQSARLATSSRSGDDEPTESDESRRQRASQRRNMADPYASESGVIGEQEPEHEEPPEAPTDDFDSEEPEAHQEAEAKSSEQPPSVWDEDSEFGFLLEFLSPIKPFLLDPDVTEVMINGPGQVYIEKAGRLHLTGAEFPSDMALVSVVQNIARSVGRTVDKRNPILDARLPDGSRVNAVVQPCARLGTYITIRKFFSGKLTIQKLIGFGAVTDHAADFMRKCVLASLNVIVTGGTGSGKTTLLNVVSDFIPNEQRIVVIEDASELQLGQEHLVPMETRQADPRTGTGRVTIRDLVRSSLRMRPDRIVVGELRGEEAFDLLQAFNTGHRGSMTTIHSNSPRDCLNRFEMLVTLAGLDVPLRAIREQIASAVDFIFYTSRLHDGSRKITHLSEILYLNDDGNYATNDIFRFKRSHVDAEGHIHGQIVPTGNKPVCLEFFEHEGITFPEGYFSTDYQLPTG